MNENEIKEKEVVKEEEKSPAEIIQDLKENSVDKKEYDKLKSDYSKLLTAYANGKQPEVEVKKEVKDVKKLSEEYLNSCNRGDSNRVIAKKALELRDTILEQEGRDIFLPTGSKVEITEATIKGAQNLYDNLKEAVEYADKCAGDKDASFMRELDRRMSD